MESRASSPAGQGGRLDRWGESSWQGWQERRAARWISRATRVSGASRRGRLAPDRLPERPRPARRRATRDRDRAPRRGGVRRPRHPRPSDLRHYHRQHPLSPASSGSASLRQLGYGEVVEAAASDFQLIAVAATRATRPGSDQRSGEGRRLRREGRVGRRSAGHRARRGWRSAALGWLTCRPRPILIPAAPPSRPAGVARSAPLTVGGPVRLPAPLRPALRRLPLSRSPDGPLRPTPFGAGRGGLVIALPESFI